MKTASKATRRALLPHPPSKASGGGAEPGQPCRRRGRRAHHGLVAIFKARSNDDLTILRAGMCPDCGAGIFRGMTACKACGLQFDNHLADLPAPKAAAPAPRPAPAPAPAAAPQQQHAQQQQPQAPQARPAPAPSAPPSDPSAWGRPLSLDDIEELERGALKPSEHPLTDAEGPEVVGGAADPLLGSSLSRAAIVVMADAAVCDDPLVLLGFAPVDSHVARAFIDLRRSDAADIDDAELLAAGPSVAPPAPVVRAAAPARAAAAPIVAPGGGRGLSLEDIEALEHPIATEQPHSFAELCDLEGISDPLLGAALIRGATAAMAEAAVIDDPLVLLGYPPVLPRDVARAMINLRRGDAALVDDVESLLKRTPVTASGPVPKAPPAPASGPVRRADPEATALLDHNAIRAAADAVAREQAKQPNRVASVISGRGGVLSLDET